MNRAALFALITAALTGCSDGSGPLPPAASLHGPDSVELTENAPIQLVVEARDSAGDVINGVPIGWQLEDSTAAHLTGGGLLSFRRPGTAHAFAMVDGQVHHITIISRVRLTSLARNRAACGRGVLGRFHCLDSLVVSDSLGRTFEKQLQSLSIAWFHQCGLDVEGRAWCRGNNWSGDLGNPFNFEVDEPIDSFVPAAGALRFRTIEVSLRGTCGITLDSLGFCWGGSIGWPITAQVEPLPIGSYKLRDIDFDWLSHACAVTSDGQVICWGENGFGQLGHSPDSIASSAMPIVVPGVANAVQVSVMGPRTCVRLANGSVICWGSRSRGAIGSDCGFSFSGCPPTPVPLPVPARTVAILDQTTCILGTDDEIYCWGAWDDAGDGSTGDRLAPGRIAADGPFVELGQSCARHQTGTVLCWGRFEFTPLPAPLPFQLPAAGP